LKIQVLSQSFYPDHSGISLYSSEFAFYAAEKGHEVEVITGYGFYPQWKKRKEDRRKLFSTEYNGKVKILRGYIYVPEKPTTFKRVIHEISLLASTSFNFFRAKKPDVIVVFTTPILLGFIAVIFKKLFKCKLIINVQDFQLEAASSLNMIKEGLFFKILSNLEKFSYANADLVTSISHSMFDILKYNKKLKDKKIYLWPNWIQKKDYILDPVNKGIFRKQYNINSSEIIIGYAGNVGLKQGLEILVELADVFMQNTCIKFFIIGGGAGLPNIIKYANDKKVKNVFFLPLLSPAEYKAFLNDLDIFFLPQKKTAFDVYFPSKLLGLIAAKKTILISADEESELFKTVKTNKIGFVTKYGDINALAVIINENIKNAEKSKEVSRNADIYVSQFERDVVLDSVLEKIIKL
jgi:colanic acid biosynthesis glycosyl transferase WcaI